MVAFLIAAVVSGLCGAVAVWVGPRLGLVDRPDGSGLKIHARPAVLLGVLPVFAGWAVGVSISGDLDPGLVVGLLVLGAIGIVDDARGIPPVGRVAGELVAGGVIWQAADLPGWTRSVGGAVLVVGLTVLAANAVNLIDGLDLLSATTVVLTSAGLAILGRPVALEALALMGALLGFAVWNRPPARLFLGDGGAYVVGGLIAYLTVAGAPSATRTVPLIAAWGVLLGDLGLTLVRRRLAGVPLLQGDRSHLYDQLLDRGRSHARTVLTMAGIQVGFVGSAIALDLLAPVGAFVGASVLGVVWLAILWRLGFVGSRRSSEEFEVADGQVPDPEVGHVDR